MSFAEKLDGTRDYTLRRLADQKTLKSLHSPSTEYSARCHGQLLQQCQVLTLEQTLHPSEHLSSAPRVHS